MKRVQQVVQVRAIAEFLVNWFNERKKRKRMPFTIEVNQSQSITSASQMQPGEFAIITDNPANPSESIGHLIFRTNSTDKPFQDLTDVSKAWTAEDTLFVDILEPGSQIKLTVLNGTPTTQTWRVVVPSGMTVQQAMMWVSGFATDTIDVSVDFPNLTVVAKIGTFNCPDAVLVSIG